MSSPEVQFLTQLCQQLYDSKTLERFNLCRLVRACLSDQQNIDAIKNDTWPRLVRDSLFEIFKNRLTDEYRDEALQLATQMTLSFDGMDWVKCEDKWDEDNSKFLVLLLRLVCIEVQLLLPRLLEDEALCSNSEMGSLLIIMEKVLIAFINNLNEDEDDITGIVHDVLQIDSSVIVSSINAVRATIREVIEFIKVISLRKDPLPEDLKHILFANIRILFFYMSEEPDELKEQIAEVLVFILKTVKNNADLSELKVIDIVKQACNDATSKAIMLRHGVNVDTIDEDFS